jgi:hypothetical protein
MRRVLLDGAAWPEDLPRERPWPGGELAQEADPADGFSDAAEPDAAHPGSAEENSRLVFPERHRRPPAVDRTPRERGQKLRLTIAANHPMALCNCSFDFTRVPERLAKSAPFRDLSYYERNAIPVAIIGARVRGGTREYLARCADQCTALQWMTSADCAHLCPSLLCNYLADSILRGHPRRFE